MTPEDFESFRDQQQGDPVSDFESFRQTAKPQQSQDLPADFESFRAKNSAMPKLSSSGVEFEDGGVQPATTSAPAQQLSPAQAAQIKIARSNIAKYPENQPTTEEPYYDPATGLQVGTTRAGPAMDAEAAQQSIVPQAAVPALQAADKYFVKPRERFIEKAANVGRNLADRALVTPPVEMGTMDPDYRPPITEQEVQEQLKGVPAPIKGAARAVGSTAAGMAADPLMWPFFFSGGAAPTLQKIATAGFAAQMGHGAYQQAGQLGQILDNPDVPREDKWEAASNLILSTIMAAQAAAHATNYVGMRPDAGAVAQEFNNLPLVDQEAIRARLRQKAPDVAAEVEKAAKGQSAAQSVTPVQLSAKDVEVQTSGTEQKPKTYRLPRGATAAQVEGDVSGRNIKTVTLDNGDTWAFDKRKVNADAVKGYADRGEMWRLEGKKAPPEAEAQARQDISGEEQPDNTAPEANNKESKAAIEGPVPPLTARDVEQEEQPQAAEQPERRTDIATRKRVADMSPDERAKELLTSDTVDLPNKRAFTEAEQSGKSPAVAMSDADGLKAFNDKFGYEAGNTLLRAKTESLKEAGLDSYHDKGDEFLHRGESTGDLKAKLEQARESLRNKEFTVTDADGKTVTLKGVDFSYGTGADLKTAESGLKTHKADREAAGERARGELRGITEVRHEAAAQSGTEEVKQLPEGVPAKGQSGRVPINRLTLAPKQFQYKLNTNEHGVTNLLAGRKFNDDLAGVISVWHNPADGKTYVVNGHHRVQLAKENGVRDLLVKHLNVDSAGEARAVGALQNIAEGRGTPVDAAKFFRERGVTPSELERRGISMGEATADKGLSLSRLDGYLFDKVVSGELPQERGVAIGKATDNPATQEAIFKLIEKAEKRGRRVTSGIVSELAQEAKRASEKTTESSSLFGNSFRTENNALDKAEVSDYIRNQIAKEKRVFGAVSSEAKAEVLGQVKDQTIKAGENHKVAQAAAQAEEAYDKLRSSKGPIDDILENAAARLAKRENPGTVKADAYKQARAELRKALPGEHGSSADRVQADTGRGSGTEENPAFSLEKPAPTFFSKAEKVAEEKLPKNVSAHSVISTLKNTGVKDEEIKWMGLDDYLKDKGLIPKQQLIDFIRQNNVQVKEVLKGGPSRPLEWQETKSGYGKPMWHSRFGGNDYSVIENTAPIGGRKSYSALRNDKTIDEFGSLEEAKAALENKAGNRGKKEAKFSNYQLPGGENYRELLMTLPTREASPYVFANADGSVLKRFPDYKTAHDYYTSLEKGDKPKGSYIGPAKNQAEFKSSHFDEPNVLAHVRFNDRISPDGKKTLFMEELQSDWHQKGRKEGYQRPELTALLPEYEISRVPRDDGKQGERYILKGPNVPDGERTLFASRNAEDLTAEATQDALDYLNTRTKAAVPDAPFKTTWHELAMKRMLRYAAENGYDNLAWTTGEQQAARYDLSKQVSEVRAFPHGNGTYDLSSQTHDGHLHDIASRIPENKLSDYVGKDLAQKIANGEGTPDKGAGKWRIFSGVDLKVGGQGMKGFYDKILPDFMNKYGKKWGAKVGETEIPTGENQWDKREYSGPSDRGTIDKLRQISQGRGGTASDTANAKDVLKALSVDTHATESAGFISAMKQHGSDSLAELIGGSLSLPRIESAPVHSIDITPSMRDSVLYEGQPLFNLPKDELRDWAQAAGRRLKIEEMGEQGGLFGSTEKMYRLSTSKQNSVAVTQTQLDALTQEMPRIGRMLGIEQPKREGVWSEYTPPEPDNLFAAAKPPELLVSKAARHLMAWTSDFPRDFRGANLSTQNIDNIAAKLEDEGSTDAIRLAEALKQAGKDAGKAGVTVLVEGSPEHVASEESFHAAQRGLGEGQIRDHLSDEAVDRLLDHPAAKAMEASLKAMGYDENLHPAFKIAEIAAKIATAQHGMDDAQAADWFVKYVDELHQQHGEANVASAFSNLYDGARELYERAKAAKATNVRPARGGEAGIQPAIEGLPQHATGPPQEGRGRGNKEHPQGKTAQGKLGEPFLLSREQATEKEDESERGSSKASALPIPALISSAHGIIEKGSNLYHGAVDKLLDFTHMGKTRPEIRQYDENAADLATKFDASGQYHKALAEMIAKKITDPLTEEFSKSDNYAERARKNEISRDRMKGFHFLADKQNREWVEKNHPDDFKRWSDDPQIAEAVKQYKPFMDQLRDAVKQLGGKVIEDDYIKRVMDFVTSGVAYTEDGKLFTMPKEGRGGGSGGSSSDNIVSPQISRSKARIDDGKVYWDHGVFDFGPSFQKKYVETMSKLDEHRLAVHAMSMGTRIAPGDEAPEKAFYNGQEFYRPDIAKEIRDVQKRGVSSESKALADALGVSELPAPGKVRQYDFYEPLRRGSRFENAARNLAANVLAGKEDLAAQAANVSRMAKLKYALPKEIVEALNDAGREKEEGAVAKKVRQVIGPVTQFIRQQIVGLGYGIPHMANILRKVVQSHPGAALNPMGWADAFKVAFSKELKQAGIKGTEDPTYDMLLRNAAVSEGAIPEYKHYIEGNMDPRNWQELAQTVGNAFKKGGRAAGEVTPLSAAAGLGRLAVEPLNRFSEAGHRKLFKPGGIDQRARIWLARFLQDRYPDMSENSIAHEVNQTLGRYNRASFTDVQKSLAPFMLFPGWDYSSIAYALKHPYKTAVAPAVITLLANAAVRSIGANKKDDSKDTQGIHIGKYRIRTNLFNDNMGSHIWGWALRGATAAMQGKNKKDVVGEMARGVPGDVAGVSTGVLNPVLSAPIAVAANRSSPGREDEIVKSGDFEKKGKVLPNKAAEDYTDFAARRMFPIYDHVTQAGQKPSLASFAGLVGVSVNERKKKKR